MRDPRRLRLRRLFLPPLPLLELALTEELAGVISLNLATVLHLLRFLALRCFQHPLLCAAFVGAALEAGEKALMRQNSVEYKHTIRSSSGFIRDSSGIHPGLIVVRSTATTGGVETKGVAVVVGLYAVAWVVAIFGVALLGEATRRQGEVLGGRAAAWIVVLAVAGFVGGFGVVMVARAT